MKYQKFREIIVGSNLREIKRVNYRGGVVLIADGSPPPDEDDDITHRTVWAFGKDENTLEIAQPIYFESYFEDQGIWREVTLDIRIAAAEKAAREWIEARGRRIH